MIFEEVERAIGAVGFKNGLSLRNLFGGGVKGQRVSRHVPAFLVGEAGEGRHIALDVAARNAGKPVGGRGGSGDLRQAERGHADGQLLALRAIAQSLRAVTGRAFFGVEDRAVFEAGRFGGEQRPKRGHGRGRDVVRRRRDILRQRETAGGEEQGKEDEENSS